MRDEGEGVREDVLWRRGEVRDEGGRMGGVMRKER